MKTYIITVNGKSYEVAVEEKSAGQAVGTTTVAAPAPVKPAVQAAPAAAPAPAPAAKPAAPTAEGTKVSAPMPGKIISVKVNVGDTVKLDQELIIMEAMKMHNPILSPGSGVVKEILIKPGDPVQTGNVLLVIG